ncbi:MAG: hypothetical protein V1887_02925 [Candidatus Aenigmatarchaeota archaeon]
MLSENRPIRRYTDRLAAEAPYALRVLYARRSELECKLGIVSGLREKAQGEVDELTMTGRAEQAAPAVLRVQETRRLEEYWSDCLRRCGMTIARLESYRKEMI